MTRKPTELKIHAKELGIDLASKQEKEYFKWFLACLLFGKPIQQEVAKRAYFELVKEDLDTPEAIIQAGWDKLVEVLDRARYVYDSSTATKLLDISKTLQEKYGTLTNLLKQSQTIDEVSARLQEFKGMGPKTAEIFLRDITPIIDSDIRTSTKVSNGETTAQFCSSCGTELPGGAHFCRQCGYPLDATVRIGRRTSKAPSSPGVAPLDGSAADSQTSIRSRNALSKLPVPVQRVIAAVLVRARDAQPEVSSGNADEATESQSISWGWLPILALTSALGMLSAAHGYTIARYGATAGDFFFWLGILIIFTPAVVRLLSPGVSRFERITLLCIVGTCFYLVDVMASPSAFSGYDAVVHWRTADDITRSAHLFSENSLLPTSPFYPGLEIVTNALSALSGLSTFIAGSIVLGVARLVMILALFILYELITKSARMAGIATMLYMSNPHFLFFDAQFSYESLALPLAALVLFAMARQEISSTGRRWVILTAWVPLIAVVVTHHLTSYVLDGFLLLWTVIYIFQHPARLRQSKLAPTALLGISLSLAWIAVRGNPVVEYLSSYFGSAVDELGGIVVGTNSARHFFAVYAGQPAPLWERIAAFSSVALIVLGLPFGLLCLWQRYRSNALACALGIASLIYPISLAFRFTTFGSEIPDRAAAFLFIPLGCVLTIFIAQFWPTQRLNRKRISLITCVISVVFVGGVVLGSGPPWELLPGPYLVAADARSIEPEGIQTAIWASSYLGPNNRIATDRTNRLLMTTYGDQHAVTALEDHIDVTPVFFSSSFGPNEAAILRSARVRYLVVDLRLSTALPSVGIYFEVGEPGSYQHTTPISSQALTKFKTIPQINRVFDGGDIVIYDVGGLFNAPEKS